MTDLPIASASPVAAARSAANASARRAAAHDCAATADESPFQAVLALELTLMPERQALPGMAVPAGGADAARAPGDDAVQAGIATDALPGSALFGVPALATLPLPADAALSPLPAAIAAASTGRAALTLDPRQAPQTSAPAVAKTELELPAAPAAAGLDAGQNPLAQASATTQTEVQLPVASPSAQLDLRRDLLARASAAARTEVPMPAASAAADLAVPGKFSLSVTDDIRREVAFHTSLLEQHKAAGAAAPALALYGSTDTSAPVTHAGAATLEAQVGERGWDLGLGDKLVWMAGKKQQVAELQLNPPDLGPLKITLTLNHDQASAQFVSAHAPVREAIEAAMPRLREMLADSGITLGNASVSTDGFRDQAQPQQRAHPAARLPAAEADALARGERVLRRSLGLVDTFA